MVRNCFIAMALMTVTMPCTAQEPVAEALQDFLDFATYTEGAITPEQIIGAGSEQFLFIDTRSAEQYQSDHIPGAANIEWRQIVGRIAEVPVDRSVVLYCDTGLLSSKAHLALRLLGHDENLKVMFGGFNGWLAAEGAATAKE